MKEEHEKHMAEYLFSQREMNFEHMSFDREIAFYESICAGDIESVRMLSTPLCGEGYGILSKDPLHNIRYHFVISAAMIARFCVKGGMTPEKSYGLSDYYINLADEARSVEEVHAIHKDMLEDYTLHMRHVRNNGCYSKPIVKVIDFISDHLHSKLSLEVAAAQLGLSSAYLSRLFKSETGTNFSDFVNARKAEYAANLLRYSEYSDLEISNLLGYSSQSYFIKIFRKYQGVTPKAYRDQFQIPDFRDLETHKEAIG